MASSNASWDYCVFSDINEDGIPELILDIFGNTEPDPIFSIDLKTDIIQGRRYFIDNISSKYDVYSSREEAWQAYNIDA